jgi:hypothetical protein
MSILKNGYFRVTQSDKINENKNSPELQVVMMAANHETLNHAETLPSWDEVKKNILATIRACNGKNAIVVDSTLLNLERKKLYYKLKEDGKLQLVTTAEADDLERASDPKEGGENESN